MKGGRTVARATRLIQMMALLCERDWEVAELTVRFRVSRMTIYRDLLVIQTEFADQCALVRKCAWGAFKREA